MVWPDGGAVVTRLHCLARYGNRALGIDAKPGDVVEVDTETAALLQRDAPGCWSVDEPEDVVVEALDGPPADRMVRRGPGRPPTVRK